MSVGSERLTAPFLGGQGLLGTEYRAQAVRFDGSTYFTRGGGLTGAADGKKGSGSVWFRIDGGDGTELEILRSINARFGIQRNSINLFAVFGFNAASVQILFLRYDQAVLAGPSWRHAMWSYDLGAGVGHLYIDDANALNTSILTNDTIDYTDTNWGFGDDGSGTLKWNGCIAELWVSFTDYLDLSLEANRRKFITANKRPVFLGPRGEYPTGSVPIVYMKGDVSTGHRNAGSGGDFSTAAGGLTGCSNAP